MVFGADSIDLSGISCSKKAVEPIVTIRSVSNAVNRPFILRSFEYYYDNNFYEMGPKKPYLFKQIPENLLSILRGKVNDPSLRSSRRGEVYPLP